MSGETAQHVQAAGGGHLTAADVPISERGAHYLPGGLMLPLGLIVVAGGAALIAVVRPVGVVLVIAGVLTLSGLTPVMPGQARVVTLFGRYLGTVRVNGLRWEIGRAHV